jgi:phosphate:Na+ symporter
MYLKAHRFIPVATLLLLQVILSVFLAPTHAAAATGTAGGLSLTAVQKDSVLAGAVPTQWGDPNSQALHEIVVRVKPTNETLHVQGVPILFSTATHPVKATALRFVPPRAITDEQGFARARVFFGSAPGVYVATARIDAEGNRNSNDDTVFFEFRAREPNWLFTLFMEIMAGLAIFMFGINFLSEGMKKSSGHRLREVMGSLTKNRFTALAIGAFVTVVFQSSTATTVMLVGFVQAGLLSFAQTLGVILGADIGTTMTVQLIAFKITDYALLALAIGFFLWATVSRPILKYSGQAIMGIGLVFYGMNMMATSITPLRTHEPFLALITEFDNPLAGVVVGTIFTAILHSSAAFIGIVIVFATQKLLSLETGIALSLGANIGTCVTALFASMYASIEAKRVAAAHTLFKIVGVVLLFPFIRLFARGIESLSGSGASIERQIANAHTIFNLGIAFAFLPLIVPFANFVERIVVERDREKGKPQRIILDDSLVDTPVLALAAAKNEVLRLGRKAQQMVDCAMTPLFENHQVARDELEKRECEVDDAYLVINDYLKKIIAVGAAPGRVEEAFQMMHTANDLEQIGDIVEDRIIPRLEKIESSGELLSPESRLELKEYHTKTLKQISRALEVFDSLNLERARHVSERFEKYRLLATELKRSHFARLQERSERGTIASEAHLDLIGALLEISDHATNIARYMLVQIPTTPDQKIHRIATHPSDTPAAK